MSQEPAEVCFLTGKKKWAESILLNELSVDAVNVLQKQTVNLLVLDYFVVVLFFSF